MDTILLCSIQKIGIEVFKLMTFKSTFVPIPIALLRSVGWQETLRALDGPLFRIKILQFLFDLVFEMDERFGLVL